MCARVCVCVCVCVPVRVRMYVRVCALVRVCIKTFFLFFLFFFFCSLYNLHSQMFWCISALKGQRTSIEQRRLLSSFPPVRAGIGFIVFSLYLDLLNSALTDSETMRECMSMTCPIIFCVCFTALIPRWLWRELFLLEIEKSLEEWPVSSPKQV